MAMFAFDAVINIYAVEIAVRFRGVVTFYAINAINTGHTGGTAFTIGAVHAVCAVFTIIIIKAMKIILI